MSRTSTAPDEAIEELHAELFDTGLLAPLELGGSAERVWVDYELASLAENRLGDATDPRDLEATRREDWLLRATTEPLYLPSRRDLERCCWIVDDGEKVGTIALATSLLGGGLMRVSSLYVLPSMRGRGYARRALTQTAEALALRDLGLRLSTSWSWQKAVRLYVRLGMWVLMWKRDLEFRWHAREPRPTIDFCGDTATMSIEIEGRNVVLYTAERTDGHLSVSERVTSDDRRIQALAWDALSTLALSLALRGWPLVRSREEWDRCYGADAGPPESLAYKIMIWEAWDRKHGWCVDAPRVASLEYPTWDELESHWKLQAEEIQKKSFRPP